jgi:hypothetical protein
LFYQVFLAFRALRFTGVYGVSLASFRLAGLLGLSQPPTRSRI